MEAHHSSRRYLILFVLSVSISMLPIFPQEFTCEIGLGAGVWTGPWNQAQRDTYTSLGLDAGLLMIPAASAAAVWKGPVLFGPIRLGVSGGLGLWSGSISGRQDGDLDRAGSILAVALEALPRMEAQIPLGKGAFVAFLELGAGFVVGPLISIDVLPGSRTIGKTPPEFMRRFLGIAGIGAGYRTGPFSFRLKVEGSIADFDPSPSGADVLGRLLVSAEYAFTRKESSP